MKALHFSFAALALVSPASARVIGSKPNGFEVQHVADVKLAPSAAMQRFAAVGSWWNPEHSYSGNAANLRLGLKVGDCFCETLPAGGGVEHMRVAYVDPGKRLTMTGALGPLLFEAAAGVMDVKFEPSGTGTRVTLNYRAAGFARGNGDKLASPVDQVLGEQLKRFAAVP